MGVVVSLILAFLISPIRASGGNPIEWIPLGGLALDGAINAVVHHNGNTYIGGIFSSVNGVKAHNVARWDGTNWFSLGQAVMNDRYYNDFNNKWEDSGSVVHALAIDHHGHLIVGGTFASVGGVTAWNIARWSGSAWFAFPGQGFPAEGKEWVPWNYQNVYAIVRNGDDLYVGGNLFKAGMVPVQNVARFSNGHWMNPGGGLRGDVLALASAGQFVFAGGEFTTNSVGLPARHLAVYYPAIPSERWEQVGGGVNGRVRSLVASGTSHVYVGGDFTSPGQRIARLQVSIAQLDSYAPGIAEGSVRALELDGQGRLIAAGTFTNASGLAVNGIAQWMGAGWMPMRSGMQGGAVRALTTNQAGRIIAAGTFSTGGGLPTGPLAVFDRYWAPLSRPNPSNGRINAILVDAPNNQVFVGGEFSQIGGIAANSLARWDGQRWHAMHSGVQIVSGNSVTQGVVNAITRGFRGELMIGGRFNRAGGRTSHAIARWRNHTWPSTASEALAPDSGHTSTVHTLFWAPNENAYYVGGDFRPNNNSRNLMRYYPEDNFMSFVRYSLHTGAYGTGMNAPVYALGQSPVDRIIQVGGVFSQLSTTFVPGSPESRNLVRYWPSGSEGFIRSVPSHYIQTEGVYAIHMDGNDMMFGTRGWPGLARSTSLGPSSGTWVDRYDFWEPVGSGLSLSNGTAHTWAITPDPRGGFIIGGEFSHAGDVPASRLARWDGSSWSAIGTGTRTGVVRAVAFDPDQRLLVGGHFSVFEGGDHELHKRSDGIVVALHIGPLLDVVGINGAVIASGETISVDKGTDFEDVMPIGNSLTRTFRVMNLGTEDLSITNAYFTGPGAAAFSRSALPSHVPYNGIDSFTITFTPIALPAIYEATLVIQSTAGYDYHVPVRGSAGCKYIKTSQNTPLGDITPSGNIPVITGSNQTVTMFSTNNRLPYTTIDGAHLGILYTHTFTNVIHNDHRLHVDFNIDTIFSGIIVTQRSLVTPDKFVDIRYNLTDMDNTPNHITVMISTNGGMSFDLMPQSLVGDVGVGIEPGNNKHIVWLAHQDWDGEYSDEAIVRLIGVDDNGEAIGDSIMLTLDTEFGVRPRIQNLRGLDTYFAQEDYFDRGKAAVFLNGIRNAYGVGSEFSVPMRVVVDWRGTGVGNIEWLVNGHVDRTSSANAQQSFSVSDRFGVGGRLEARATGANGGQSVLHRANFDIVKPPKLWTRYTATAPFAGNKTYLFLQPSFSMNKQGSDTIPSKSPSGKDMPGGGNNKYENPMSFSITGEVDLEGSGKLGASMSREWEFSSIKVTPTVGGGVTFDYEFDETDWLYGGYFTLGVSIAKESQPKYLTLKPPLYGKLGAKVEVNGTIFFDEYFDPMWGATEIQITPGFWGTLGAGLADFASVEGSLGLDIPNTFQIEPFEYDLSLSLNASIRANVLGWSVDIWSERWPFQIYKYPSVSSTSLAAKSMDDVSRSLVELKPAEFTLMSRDYLRKKGDGRQLYNRVAGRDGRVLDDKDGRANRMTSSDNEHFLQPDGFPYSEPALAISGDERILLWIADAGPDRIGQNMQALSWSRWDGTTYAYQGLVWDDGTGDSKPQLGLLPGGQAIAAWQNGGYVLSSTSHLAEALSSLEIAVGHFDGTDWQSFNLTTNTVMDRNPRLSVAANGTALLTWQRNDSELDEESLIMSGVDTLMSAFWNGTTWSAPTVVTPSAGLVVGASLAWNGNVGYFFVALDADRDISTDFDQEIYRATYSGGSWGSLTRVTVNDVQDTQPQAVFDYNGDLLVVWFQEGKMVSSTSPSLTSPVVIGEVGKTTAAMDFRLIAGPQGEISVIWTDSTDEPFFQNPVILNYDRAFNRWSLPVPLLNDSAFERSFSGAFTTNAAIALVYNKVEVHFNENNVVTNMGPVTALAALEYQIGRDIAVFAKDIRLLNWTNSTQEITSVLPGMTALVEVVFRNVGELAVTGAWARIYRGNPAAGGVLLNQGRIDTLGPWVAGDSYTLNTQWIVAASTNPVPLFAVAELDQVDRNLANNTAWISPMRPDYAITRFHAEKVTASIRMLKVEIRNLGALAAPTNNLVLRLENSTGDILAVLPVDALEPSLATTLQYEWDMSGHGFTSAFVRVHAAVDEDNAVEESDETNNAFTRRVMTPLDSDGDGLLDGEELRYGTDPFNPDTDGDGLTDYEEIMIYNTNPLDPDTDGDGLTDYEEIMMYGTDPRNPDTDGDGFSDGVEVQKGTNPLDPNSFPTGMLILDIRGSPAPFGVVRPLTYGTNHYDSGVVVTSRVEAFVPFANGNRRRASGWTGTGSVPPSGTETQVVFTILADSSLTWNFATQYELDLDITSDGSTIETPGAITGHAAGWYDDGQSVTLQVEPVQGYRFAGWRGDLPTAMTNQNPLTLTMSEPRVLFAHIVRQSHTLHVLSSRGQPSPPVGVSTYAHEELLEPFVNSPIVSAGLMYESTGWTMTGHDPASGPESVFNMFITNNATLTWHWRTNALLQVTSAGMGSVSGSTPGWYALGDPVTLTATPEPFNILAYWSGDVPPALSVTNPLQIAMSQARTITAVFTNPVAQVSLNAVPSQGGTATGGGSFAAGTTITLSAHPSANWLFSGWSDGYPDPVRDVTVPIHATNFTATFTPWMVTVTTLSDPADGGTATGGGTYQAGSSIHLSAAAQPNWNFAGWSDGISSATRSVVVPTNAVSFTAEFIRNAPAIWYVRTNGNDNAAGTNWFTAKQTLQAASDLARNGDIIYASNGVYNVGGSAVTGSALLNRVALTNAATLIAVNGPRHTAIVGEPGMRGVYLAEGASLQGFTVTNGHTLVAGAADELRGGGVWAAPSAEIHRSIIAGNTAQTEGGGVFGGRVYNSLLHDNTADQGGGAYGTLLVNATVSANIADIAGGAHSSTSHNSIVYGNIAVSASNYTGGTFAYSLAAPLPAGTSNQEANPMFGKTSQRDFRLRLLSPALDAANNGMAEGDVDLLGQPRIQNGTVDMGAYEGAVLAADPLASYAGAAIFFDGVDDHLSVAHAAALSFGGDFTIEAWVRIPDHAAARPIVTKQPSGLLAALNLPGQYEFRIEQGTGRLAFGFEYADYSGGLALWSSAGSVPAGTYTHVAVVYKAGSSVQFFINGVPDAQHPTALVPLPNTRPVLIGARADGLRFKGEMDEVRLWNTARAASALAATHRQRMAGDEPGLVAYWRMDDGAGTTAADDSGNGHIATLLNGASFQVSSARVDRARASSTNALVLTLSGFELGFPADTLTPVITGLPSGGSLRQYGTMDPINTIPTDVTDAQRRVIYLPPADFTGTDSFAYRVFNGDILSPNVATVSVDVATSLIVPLAHYPGGALQLDGAGAHVQVPHSQTMNLSWAMTLEAWIKIDDLDRFHPIITKQASNLPGNYEFRVDQTTGRLTFGFTRSSFSPFHLFWQSAGSIPEGQWTHVAVTFRQDDAVQFFINGAFDSVHVTGNPFEYRPVANTHPLRIGARADGLFLKGELDEVRIWGRDLPGEEVSAFYRQRRVGNEGGLMAYWTMDDGDGFIVSDASPNSLSGSIVGGAPFRLSGAGVDRAFMTSMQDVVLSLGAFKSNSVLDGVTATLLNLPVSGEVKQYGTLDPIVSVPAAVTDSERRIVYTPPPAAETYFLEYRVNDGTLDSPNVATVQLVVATISAGRFVNITNTTPAEPYTTWTTAATNIQQAIEASVAGDLITVAPGVYETGGGLTMPGRSLSNRVYVNKAVTLRSLAGPEVTIIRGNGMRTMALTAGAVVEGFTITDGSTLSGSPFEDESGGGVWAVGAVLSNCVITGNAALGFGSGGGAVGGTFYNSVIKHNTAHQAAGAYGWNPAGIALVLHNSLVISNTANFHSGGLYGATVHNSLIAYNHSIQEGGAGAGLSTLYNCTVVGNTTVNGFGDTAGLNGGWAYNSIVVSNVRNGVTANYGGTDFHHSLTTPHPGGTGNLDADPMFENYAAGNFALRDGSPALNVGDTAYATNYLSDLAGNLRVQNYIVEMGAFESPAVLVTVVADPSEGGTVAGTGSYSPGAAHLITATPEPLWQFEGWSDGSAQRALTITVPTENMVYTGTFVRPAATWYVATSGSDAAAGTNWATARQTIQSAIQSAIDGDLVLVSNGTYNVGSQVAASHNNRIVINKPITVKSLNGPGVTTIRGSGGGQGPSAIRGAYVGDGAVLDGFTVSGGATFWSDGDPLMEQHDGGGIYSTPDGIIRNCIITGNTAARHGGGIYGGLVQHSIIQSNTSFFSAAGVYGASVEGSIIHQHNGLGAGASELRNTVVAYNEDGVDAVTAYNSIVYFNTTANHSGSVFHHSATTPNPGGTGNIIADPQFVDGPGGDYRLIPGSPAINAGDNTYAAPATDLLGMPRIADGTVDMGAYESQVEALITAWASPAEGGSVTGGGIYSVGSTAVLHAVASEQWLFDGWTDGETSASREVVVPGTNVTLTALFARLVHVQVQSRPEEGGAVTGGGTYKSGTTVELNATAYEPWIFTRWSHGVTNNSVSVTAPFAEVVYHAHFAKVTPPSGPESGGTIVTITNGYFGLVTNVLLDVTSVAVVASGVDWVTIQLPVPAPVGVHDVTVQTFEDGETRIPAGYTVHPAGKIHGPLLPRPTHGMIGAGMHHTVALRADGTAVTWGNNQFEAGQNNIPVPNAGFITVAAGDSSSLYLRSDHSIATAGWNLDGQLNVPAPNEGYAMMSSGDAHALYLRSNGVVTAVGWNFFGQANPPPVNGDFITVAAGANHSLALVSHGTIYAWGANGQGQCNVPAPNSNFVSMAAGNTFSVGLKDDGTVVTWGTLGLPPGLNEGFVAVAAGRNHALAIKTNGSVVAWGDNPNGQLNVPAPNIDFVEVAGGGEHSIGLKEDGSLVVWGSNARGQHNIPAPNRDYGVNTPAVVPDVGDVDGGYEVTILGSNLGSGSDIVSVTLAGVPAVIVHQSATQVIVVAGAAPGSVTGDVYMVSSSFGVTVRENGFTYLQPQSQTINFPAIPDQVVTSLVVLAATATSGLPVDYDVVSGPAVVVGDTLTFNGVGVVRLSASQSGNALWLPATTVTSEFVVDRVMASITLGALAQTYDGSVRAVTADTSPEGRDVRIRYAGLTNAPVDAGEYEITAEILDAVYQGTATGTLVVARASATVYLLGLEQWHDGSARFVTATSMPAGLNVTFTYEGGEVPILVGSYTVTGTVHEANYEGEAAGTLHVFQGQQEISVAVEDNARTTEATPVLASATSGLPVGLEILSGPGALSSATSPAQMSYSAAGDVVVRAHQAGNAQWEAAPDQMWTVTVERATAAIHFAPVTQTYDGSPRVVTPNTVPAGLPVFVTYDGSIGAPVLPGIYTVTGVVDTVMYDGELSIFLSVLKAEADIYLHDFEQLYDGTARHVTATTMPAGLVVEFTYDGDPEAPVESGEYYVTAMIDDDLYAGSSTGTLVVLPVDQHIVFDPIPNQVITNTTVLSATSSAGLPIFFEVIPGPAYQLDPVTLAYQDRGWVMVIANQPGEGNVGAAEPVTISFRSLGIFTVAVESAYAYIDPPAGEHPVVEDMVITNTVTSPVTLGTTQLVASAWTLEDHDPFGGAGTEAVFAVTNHTRLIWTWSTNYWFAASAGPNGSVSVTGAWVAAGGSVEVGATPNAYFYLDQWTGDAAGDDNPLIMSMIAPQAIHAMFAAHVTTNRNVPLWWLAEYGITNQFEISVDMDHDGDGVSTGDEYIADTDPTDPQSYLRFADVWPAYGTNFWTYVWTNPVPPYEIGTSIVYETIGQIFVWPASPDRVYDVDTTTRLESTQWSPLDGMTNLTGVGGSITLTNFLTEKEMELIRIRVRLPNE